MVYRVLLAILFTVSIAQPSYSQPIPTDTAVHSGQLANGFTYYIRHNEEPKNRVQLYLVSKVGSVLEDPDQQGLAHFMEHMNFNGTKHFPKNKLVDYLQKSGVRFGADLNAYTSFDETVFQLPIPTDDPKVLASGFQIMRDWAQDATLDSIEIEKERGVVLEERRLGRGAGERMQRQYFPVMLNHSRYAERQPIGLENILVNFKPATIRRFHHDWYRPDLQALIVVGDINVQQTEALVRQLFGDLVNPPGERERTIYRTPLTGENHFLVVTDKEMPTTEFQILVKHPEEKLTTDVQYIHSMERELFNEMVEIRLAEVGQAPNPPFVTASAGIGDFLGGLDAFSLAVTPKQGRSKEAFETAWAVLERVKRFGFTPGELDRARTAYLRSTEAEFREKDKTPSTKFVSEYQHLFLDKEAAPGIDWEYHFVQRHLPAIALADIDSVTRQCLRETNRDILVLAPDSNRQALPDSATFVSWIRAVSQQNMTAYVDSVSNQPLLKHRPAGGRIVSEKTNPALHTVSLVLSNGLHVILKPTDFKQDEIVFTAYGPGGTSLYPNADFLSAANAATLIGSFGVGDFTPIQLEKALTGKRVSVSPSIEERAQGINGYCSPKDLETALQLVYDRFTAPRKDSVLFHNLIASARDQLANRYRDPGNVFKDTMNYVLGNYNYRRSPITAERLGQIDLDKAYAIYRDRFSDAAGFTFVFVGNFTVDSIKPLLAEYLGGLPGLHRNDRAKDLGIHAPGGQLSKTVYKGSENKATVRLVYSGDYQYGGQNNLTLRALAEVLSIKLIQHLREDESEVYSPSVQPAFSKIGKGRYTVTVAFGCAPKNVEHLIGGVVREIRAIRDSGATAEDVDKFKAEYARSRELQLKENRFWLSYLVGKVENGDDPMDVFKDDEYLKAITPASLRVAADTYLSGKNLIRFVLVPEGGK